MIFKLYCLTLFPETLGPPNFLFLQPPICDSLEAVLLFFRHRTFYISICFKRKYPTWGWRLSIIFSEYTFAVFLL